jgi:hypothetical protein
LPRRAENELRGCIPVAADEVAEEQTGDLQDVPMLY